MGETDLISRQAAIDALKTDASFVMFDDHGNYTADGLRILEVLTALPSVQPEPLTLRVNNELTKEEYDKLMQDIKDAPVVLLPSEQPDRKTGEWLHEYLQTAVDFGIITETQASRLMDMIAEDKT